MPRVSEPLPSGSSDIAINKKVFDGLEVVTTWTGHVQVRRPPLIAAERKTSVIDFVDKVVYLAVSHRVPDAFEYTFP
jgi:hypothetical protein